MASKQSVYRVTFINHSTIYEVYAQHVSESDLFGFIEVEKFVFGNLSSVVLDPSEERIKNEFDSVKRTFIPMQLILRIDQVDKEGVSKVRDVSAKQSNNVSIFPGVNSSYTDTIPQSKDDESN